MAAGSEAMALLLSMETLSMGVAAKRCLWQALGELAADVPAVARLDLATLVKRADAQLDVLEAHRRAAAPAALTHP